MMDPLALLPEERNTRFDSRHRLVVAASQRAKQLMQGAKPVVSSKFAKETTVAIDEILQGRVDFLTGKEARQAMREAKRIKESDIERIAMVSPAASEDAREIKKELSVYVDDSGKGAEPEAEE
ncbi:MAG: DNA-directed RNA polymerase subunit omega [Nitrospiraceae bacterium]